MEKPKVSVIIPVYNSEKYLERCLNSVVNQTLKEIEIIIVDDGSKELCASLCDELAKSDSRIQIIHKENGGAGLARNEGLKAAVGEYIGFVDSDDYIDPFMYEKLYDAAMKYDADLVLSGVCFVGGNTFSKPNEFLSKAYFDRDTVFEKDSMKKLLLGVAGALPDEPDDSRYGVSVWKNIFRTDLMKEQRISFLSERKIFSEDTLFMVDFIKHAGRAVGISGVYYYYCRNEGSFSKSYNSEHLEKCMVFLNELEKRIEDVVRKDEYKIYLDRLAQGYGRVLCSQEIVYAKEKRIRYSVLRRRLMEICTKEEIVNALKTYPWYRLPIKQAAFAFAMKYRLFLFQKIMVLLRDKGV